MNYPLVGRSVPVLAVKPIGMGGAGRVPRQALPVGGGVLLRRPGTEHEPLDSNSGDIGV